EWGGRERYTAGMHDSTQGDKQAAHGRLVDRLRAQADDVRRLTSGLDESQLSTRTVPDKWSLKELVCHLVRVQELFEARVEKLLAEDDPAIASYEPESDPAFDAMVARPSESSLRALLDGRQRLAARLATLGPAEWHRTGRHPDYPRYD